MYSTKTCSWSVCGGLCMWAILIPILSFNNQINNRKKKIILKCGWVRANKKRTPLFSSFYFIIILKWKIKHCTYIPFDLKNEGYPTKIEIPELWKDWNFVYLVLWVFLCDSACVCVYILYYFRCNCGKMLSLPRSFRLFFVDPAAAAATNVFVYIVRLRIIYFASFKFNRFYFQDFLNTFFGDIFQDSFKNNIQSIVFFIKNPNFRF